MVLSRPEVGSLASKVGVCPGKGMSAIPAVRNLMQQMLAVCGQPQLCDDTLSPFSTSYLQQLSADIRSWWPNIVAAAEHPETCQKQLELHCSTIDRWSTGADVAAVGLRGRFGVLHFSAETLLYALCFSEGSEGSTSRRRHGGNKTVLRKLERSARVLLGHASAAELCASTSGIQFAT